MTDPSPCGRSEPPGEARERCTLRTALRSIAAWSAQSGLPSIPAELPGEEALLDGIGRERLTGLALAAADADALRLSAGGADELRSRHEHQLALDLQLERVLVESASILDREGISYRALKGPLLAHLAYPDPALRSFGDVDVLVAGASFDAAVRALATLGFRRHFAEPRPGFDARFAKGACLARRDGMEIDLHRTLAPGPFGILLERVDLIRRPARAFRLGSHSIAGLDAETAFVHACFHAALGNHPPRLVPLRDIVQLHTAGLDTGAVVAMFTSARCESVCRRALDLVAAELEVHLEGPIPAWAGRQRPSRFDRWALQSYASDDRSYAGQVAASIWAIPSLRDRFAYTAALAFPTREYVRAHDRGYARRIARGLRVVKESLPVRRKRSAAEPEGAMDAR
jgi:hypothetical protein